MLLVVDEGICERVSRLFAILPGVRIAWVEPTAALGCVRFGLQVSDPKTLTQLVHLARFVNVPVSVEVDWNCNVFGHDDPACLRYDFRVPIGPDDERLSDLENLLIEMTEGYAKRELR
jgi:hypothetical protein